MARSYAIYCGYLVLFMSALLTRNTVYGGSIITTFAGTGATSFSGDNGQATSAQLYYPYDVAVDSSDMLHNVIRKVDTSGIITTIAGTGAIGSTGDGSAATSAKLYYPLGVALDSTGNVYIADTYNHIIRKVDTSGIITTIAGTRSAGFSGDGGAATSATLNYPFGVALDSTGNIYIGDRDNSVIRKVDTSGIITTFAGTAGTSASSGYSGDLGLATSAQLNKPTRATVDSVGNVYIADTTNNVIRKVDTSSIITTVVGTGTAGNTNGAATSAKLDRPYKAVFDSTGNMYIVELGNHAVRKVDTSDIIAAFAGGNGIGSSGNGGAATSAKLSDPIGITIDSSGANLYIADSGNQLVRKVTTTTDVPTYTPTVKPTTAIPTAIPSAIPTDIPTDIPTAIPTTAVPTTIPTTAVPTAIPTTAVPTLIPTDIPTDIPTTAVPTITPTDNKSTLTSNSDNDSSPISYPEIAGIVIAASIASALVAYYCYQRNRRLNSQVPKTENKPTTFTVELYNVGVKSI